MLGGSGGSTRPGRVTWASSTCSGQGRDRKCNLMGCVRVRGCPPSCWGRMCGSGPPGAPRSTGLRSLQSRRQVIEASGLTRTNGAQESSPSLHPPPIPALPQDFVPAVPLLAACPHRWLLPPHQRSSFHSGPWRGLESLKCLPLGTLTVTGPCSASDPGLQLPNEVGWGPGCVKWREGQWPPLSPELSWGPGCWLQEGLLLGEGAF